MLKINDLRTVFVRVSLCAGLGLVAACTDTEVLTVMIDGKPYEIGHIYSKGSFRLGSVNSYTIDVDGKLLRCSGKQDCINVATAYIVERDATQAAESIVEELSTEVSAPPVTPRRVEPPKGDGVPELLRKPEETSFGD